MESHNECCKFPLGQVLHFVNREQYTGARCESGLTKLDEKVCEVVIKQTGICPTGLLGKINRQERTVSSRNMHLHETSQNPERSLRSILDSLFRAQLEQRTSRHRGHRSRQMYVFARLVVLVKPSPFCSDDAEFVQQYCFANAAQAL